MTFTHSYSDSEVSSFYIIMSSVIQRFSVILSQEALIYFLMSIATPVISSVNGSIVLGGFFGPGEKWLSWITRYSWLDGSASYEPDDPPQCPHGNALYLIFKNQTSLGFLR